MVGHVCWALSMGIPSDQIDLGRHRFELVKVFYFMPRERKLSADLAG
jgi:hypothetical protein